MFPVRHFCNFGMSPTFSPDISWVEISRLVIWNCPTAGSFPSEKREKPVLSRKGDFTRVITHWLPLFDLGTLKWWSRQITTIHTNLKQTVLGMIYDTDISNSRYNVSVIVHMIYSNMSYISYTYHDHGMNLSIYNTWYCIYIYNIILNIYRYHDIYVYIVLI